MQIRINFFTWPLHWQNKNLKSNKSWLFYMSLRQFEDCCMSTIKPVLCRFPTMNEWLQSWQLVCMWCGTCVASHSHSVPLSLCSVIDLHYMYMYCKCKCKKCKCDVHVCINLSKQTNVWLSLQCLYWTLIRPH